MGKMMDDLLRELAERKAEIRQMGGPEQVAKQHARGKMTARERIAHLFDPGSFTELGMFVRSQIKDFKMQERSTPADGVIIGHGKIKGRDVCVYATDFTVLAGSAGESHSKKIADIIGLAGKLNIPVVGLLDSAGARLHEGTALSRPFNEIFINQSQYSGVIPQIQVLLGPCAAGQGYSPMLSDFLIMVRGTSWMWLGGPRLTKSIVKEDLDAEIGSADFCMRYSGQCDFVADNDQQALDMVIQLLGYIPQNWRQLPPEVPCDDPVDRREESLLEVLPEDRRFTYDIHEIIEKVVDRDSFFEVKRDFATNIVTGFCRLDGKVIGLIANNPDELGGVLENDSSDKYYRFMRFCDAFNIPLLTIMDTPAFVVGHEWEKYGILRHGAKLLYAYSCATVPKISLIVRRAYGGGNVVMGSKTLGADFSFVWPTAEISIMGPESAASIIWSQDLEKAKESPELSKLLEEKRLEYHEQYINPFKLAENYRYNFIDDIIDPRDTRSVLIRAFAAARGKKVSLPERKHGNPPI
ncbi:MAG: acyl-CoA carboxylase subunit beta [Thermodesulfobacteriota bacterium]